MQKICKNWDFMIQGYLQLFVYSFHFFWNWLLFLHDKYNFQCPALYFQVPQIVPKNLLEWMLLFPLSRMRRQSRLEWVQTEQTSLTLQLLLSMLGKWDVHPCHMTWKIVKFTSNLCAWSKNFWSFAYANFENRLFKKGQDGIEISTLNSDSALNFASIDML